MGRILGTQKNLDCAETFEKKFEMDLCKRF